MAKRKKENITREKGIIERGEIVSVDQGKYKIASLDRDGIITPPMLPIDDKEYAVGDKVYYFYFKDGTGRIICGL